MSLQDLFPDPSDFVPPSPTFTFPPLPPTPPDNEETETFTESTGKTEIEVVTHQKSAAAYIHVPQPEPIQSKSRHSPYNKPKPRLENENVRKNKLKCEKKKTKANHNQLPLPTVQMMQQGSSEREIMDSIALAKNKMEKKEERHTRTLSRKGKRRKEKKENSRPATAEPIRKKEKEFCEKCFEKKLRRKIAKEMAQERDLLRAAEEQIVFDPEEPFVDRQIEEAEVLRRYIDTEKVYDDTISMKSYCVCSLHAEDFGQQASGAISPLQLSQQKLEQVRDAVLVVRNWKQSKEIDK